MVRIAICDENQSFLERLYWALSKWFTSHCLKADILVFVNGEDLLYHIEESGQFQIVFIEIELRKSDGLTIAADISHRFSSTMIIFVSSLEHCHKRIYQVHPFYLFTKPIKYEELSIVMDEAVSKLDNDCQMFHFSIKSCFHSVPAREIIYFFSEGRRIGVVSKDKTYYFYGKLDFVNHEMQKCMSIFLRIHKSYLVNMRHVMVYHADCIEVTGNASLPISRSKKKAVKDIFHIEWSR